MLARTNKRRSAETTRAGSFVGPRLAPTTPTISNFALADRGSPFSAPTPVGCRATTNGGHRIDFSVYRSEDGGLSYEASTPELLPRLEARGEVSPEDYQALREVFENLDGSRIETSFGHDCTYYAIYQRGGEHPHRYYQWYGCGPMSFEADPVSGMLEKVFRSTLYQEALSELARLDNASQSQ